MNYSHTCKFREGVTIQNQNDKKVAKWCQCNSLVTHWLRFQRTTAQIPVREKFFQLKQGFNLEIARTLYLNLRLMLLSYQRRQKEFKNQEWSQQHPKLLFIFNCPFLAPKLIYCKFPILQLILVFLYSTSTNTSFMNDPKYSNDFSN